MELYTNKDESNTIEYQNIINIKGLSNTFILRLEALKQFKTYLPILVINYNFYDLNIDRYLPLAFTRNKFYRVNQFY